MTNDKCRMTKRKRARQSKRPLPPRDPLELYHVIIQCRDETQQRQLYERLRREGYPCRVVVL